MVRQKCGIIIIIVILDMAYIGLLWTSMNMMMTFQGACWRHTVEG